MSSGPAAVPYAITSTPIGGRVASLAASVRSLRGRGRRAGASASGGVSGSTPWPRLKTWPSRPPARRGRRAPCARRPPTARRARRGRGCPGSARCVADRGPRPRRAAPASRRRATSPPARAISPSSSPVPTPKWIDRHVEVGEPVEQPPTCAAARGAGSRRGSSAPTHESKTCSACAPASTWARRCGHDDRDERAHQGVPRDGSPSISAFVRAWSRLGPPSTR